MAWTSKGVNGQVAKLSESYTLPASATVGYSSVIDINAFLPNYKNEKKYVTFTFKPSNVSGTDLDIALYGCDKDGSNPVLLKDAIVADIANGSSALVAGVVDINAYPYEAYKVGWTAQADESANTITVGVYA